MLKKKLMTNSASGIQREMKVKGHKLRTLTSVKCLRAIVSAEDSKPVVLSRIAQVTVALTKMTPIWEDNISIFHGHMMWTEKSVTRATDRNHQACLEMPNSDPE